MSIVNLETEFGDLVREGKEICKRINRKGEGLVYDHFDLGCLIKDLVGKVKYGEGAVERFAEEIKVNESSLRIAYGVCKFYRFKKELIEKKVKEMKDSGQPITWAYFRGIVKPASNPEVHGSPEKHRDFLLGRAESAAGDVAEAAVHYPEDEQVRGAALGVASTIIEAEFTILGSHNKSGITKEDRWVCDQYRKFIKQQPCVIRNITGKDVEPHHLVYTSRGNQGSDIFCVPLCREYHDEYHALGRAAFEEKYDVDFSPIVIHYVQRFITEILK